MDSQIAGHLNKDELSSRYIEDRIFEFSNLVRSPGYYVEDKVFENCTIFGPALVAVLPGTDFVNCKFMDDDHDSLIWVASRGRARHVGAVHLRRCTFRNCTFLSIGILLGMENESA